MTVKSSISLTDSQHAFARSLVEQGHFASVSSVMQRGVELLRERAETDKTDRDALRALLQARSGGEFVPIGHMDTWLDQIIAEESDKIS